MSPAQSTVGIAQGRFASSQLFGPVSALSARGHNSATGAFREGEVGPSEGRGRSPRATLACLVCLNRLRSVNSAQLAAATLAWGSGVKRFSRRRLEIGVTGQE